MVLISPFCSIENGNRLACLGNAIDDPLRPARLDTDDNHGGNIGIGTGADHCPEMQLKVFTKLQPAISMRQGHCALDIVCRFTGSVRDIINRQDCDIITDANAIIFTPIAKKLLFIAM